MTQDRDAPPADDRRDNPDRRSENRSDRRAHDRYMPGETPPIRSDRRQGDRRRSEA